MEDLNVKISVLPKAIYRVNAVSSKNPMPFFAQIEKPILKFIQNLKGYQIAKIVLKKNNKTGQLKLPESHDAYFGPLDDVPHVTGLCLLFFSLFVFDTQT